MDLNIKDCKTSPDPSRKGFSRRYYPTGTNRCPIKAAQRVYQLDPSTSPSKPLLDYRSPAERRRSAPPSSSRRRFTKWVTKLLDASGIDDKRGLKRYKSHSFRSGAACTLAQSQLSAPLLKMAGRWRSDAYLVYLECVLSTPGGLRDIDTRLSKAPLTTNDVTGWTPP